MPVPSRTRQVLRKPSSGLLGTLDEAISDAEDLVLDALDRRGTVFDLFA